MEACVVNNTVFFSWQSDLDGRITRHLIRDALEVAVAKISVGLEEAERPTVTSDTQGVAGTPDIVATILRKIDNASVFVADVTPIAISVNGKACANPNVLIELGWANKSLSEHRVIQVWNTHFDGANVAHLPFDMRGRRGPLSFNISPDANSSVLRSVRDDLATRLASALQLSLSQVSPPPKEVVAWQPHFGNDPDLWFDGSNPRAVNHPDHGTKRMQWERGEVGFARIVPSRWTPDATAKMALGKAEGGWPALLSNPSSVSYGISQGGTVVFDAWKMSGNVYLTSALTQWFEKTGEFWGVGGGFFFHTNSGRRTIATGYFYNLWYNFLKRNCELALRLGGSLPIHVRIGISNIANSWWPTDLYQFDDEGYLSTEPSFEYFSEITNIDQETLQSVCTEAFNRLAAIYGKGPFTHDQIVAFSRPKY